MKVSSHLESGLARVCAGRQLTRSEAREVFADALTNDVDPIRLAGLLGALGARGETTDEICGAAEAMRAAAVPFEHDAADAIDTCGTGGDGLGMFNLSTASAIVAAAAGARVIKHGNRAASSRSGSADLLEALGLPLELEPDAAREVFEECDITFLFAPLYHPALRSAAPVRRSLGVRTIFNSLGPLCHPGRIKRQLLGVARRQDLARFGTALGELGCERAYVIHGAGGADELTLAGSNDAHAIGSAPSAAFDAKSLRLPHSAVSALAGGDADHNASLLRRVLAGASGPLRTAIALNTAAALMVAERASNPTEGLDQAFEAIDSGAARALLDRWIDVARRVGGVRGARR